MQRVFHFWSVACFFSTPACPNTRSSGAIRHFGDILKKGRRRAFTSVICAAIARFGTRKRTARAAPIVCTYLGRGDAKSGRPFRFILNHSKATVANVYLAMYPTPLLENAMRRDPQLIRAVWCVLNRISPDRLLGEGRVYGGGLHKLEPKELANVPAQDIADLLPTEARPLQQHELFVSRAAE